MFEDEARRIAQSINDADIAGLTVNSLIHDADTEEWAVVYVYDGPSRQINTGDVIRILKKDQKGIISGAYDWYKVKDVLINGVPLEN